MAVDADAVRQLVEEGVPHMRDLGMQVVAVEPGVVTLALDWQERLVGNPETGVLHGGVITVLIDSASGFAVFTALARVVPVATLDLRIDYLKPATPRRRLVARAECYKLTRQVAFTRAIAFHEEDDPIAHSAGSFMLSTPGPTMAGRTGQAAP
jgi:uncharacterized protein (TIGR00369 family)